MNASTQRVGGMRWSKVLLQLEPDSAHSGAAIGRQPPIACQCVLGVRTQLQAVVRHEMTVPEQPSGSCIR